MTDPYVTLELINHIAYIEFFDPVHNSLSGDILEKLANTITQAGKNEEVTVIVLKSGGDRTFCAGASLTELININDEATGKLFFSGFAHVINAMRKCPKFVIGRVQGKTVGGGVGLASATDYCMATQFAAIKLSELSIGIGPIVIGLAVQRKLGLSAMSQIAMDANSFYSAEWAKNKGLYTEVYESTEALDKGVKAFAEQLCKYSPQAMYEMKTMFWAGTENWDKLLNERAAINGRMVLSKFTKENLKRYK